MLERQRQVVIQGFGGRHVVAHPATIFEVEPDTFANILIQPPLNGVRLVVQFFFEDAEQCSKIQIVNPPTTEVMGFPPFLWVAAF